jgi:hypothetical protein
MSVNLYQTTWRKNLEDNHFQTCRHENPNSHLISTVKRKTTSLHSWPPLATEDEVHPQGSTCVKYDATVSRKEANICARFFGFEYVIMPTTIHEDHHSHNQGLVQWYLTSTQIHPTSIVSSHPIYTSHPADYFAANHTATFLLSASTDTSECNCHNDIVFSTFLKDVNRFYCFCIVILRQYREDLAALGSESRSSCRVPGSDNRVSV